MLYLSINIFFSDPENKRCVQLSFKESAEETDKSAKQIQAEQENPLVIKKVKERKDNEGSGDDDAKSTKKETKKLKSFPDRSDQQPNEPKSTDAETSIKNTNSETTDPIKKKGSNKTKGSKRKRNSQKLSPSNIVLK